MKWPQMRMLPLISWNDEFLEEDVMGPPEYRFVKLNVTMPARLATEVTEVDVTVPKKG